eukprot:CAMPEP_0185839158 /NCGR_PEP_ID=MMETSP1353-20130828/14147_1 /TAXON_ID=1077150 /ORGANISM="Erythrolobus australicus, Strain CCMP3124" /LENGTH=113 /DNA_ID=CAMNT_0028538283 /DNA_START=133 /DNA_END=474 /DNA_ORIENTATION=+
MSRVSSRGASDGGVLFLCGRAGLGAQCQATQGAASDSSACCRGVWGGDVRWLLVVVRSPSTRCVRHHGLCEAAYNGCRVKRLRPRERRDKREPHGWDDNLNQEYRNTSTTLDS